MESVTDAAFTHNPSTFIHVCFKATMHTVNNTAIGQLSWTCMPDGLLDDDPTFVDTAFTSFFEQLYSCNTNQPSILHLKTPCTCWCKLCKSISVIDAIKAIKHMKAKTASRLDDLPASLVKQLILSNNTVHIPAFTPIARALIVLWFHCIKKCHIYNTWQASNFTLLPKNEHGLASNFSAM